MSKVASAAAAMGVGEDQLAAQLSTIISVTKQAPESVGSALRTIYARISDIQAGISEDGVTLGNYSGKMAELGINVLDANGKLRDMGEVMEEIGGKWGDLTREQQVYLAQTMAGQRQYNNLLALFDNFEEYNKALNTAQNAAGTLQKQQDTYMESTAAHLQVLKASVEDIYDSLADTDSINGLIDGLSTAATFTANLVDGLGGGEAVLRSLGAIGVTVFSKQIGAGLVTTINNLEKARLQTESFKQAIAQAQKMQDQGLGDEYTQFLLGQQEQLLNLGGKLPENEYNAMQEKLVQLSQNSGNIDIIEEKIELLGKAFNTTGIDFEEFTAEWGTLDEALASANGVEEIKNALKEYKQNFDPIIDKQKQAKKAFKLMFQDIQKDSPNAAQSFENFKIKLQDLIETLQTAKIKKTGESLFDSLPESARKAVNQASQELAKLDFSKIGNPQQASNQITQIFRTLNLTINSEIQKIKQLMESADTGQLEGLKKKLEALYNYQKQIEDEFDKLKDRASRTIKTQDLVSFAGGIAQLGSSIQQLQNLGSIAKNKDLTWGQRALQIITNLAVSLPMLGTGFTKVTKALGLMEVKTKEAAIAEGEAITADSAHVVSLGNVSIAADKAGLKIQTLKTVLSFNPFTLLIAGAVAAVTAIGAFINASDEANKKLIESKQAEIDAENKKQEEIEKNKQLLTSLEDLNKKYEDGEITRSDLKSTIQDLIDQYGLEGKAADDLAHSYDNLADYIKRAREEGAKQAKESADRELSDARTEVNATAKGTASDAGSQSGSNYRLNIGAGSVFAADEPEQIEQLLKDAGALRDGADFTFLTDFDTEHIVTLYDTIQGIVDQIDKLREEGKLTDQQLQGSEYYQNMLSWLKQMKKSVEDYKAALKNVSKYSTELTAITGKVDFSDVQNVNQYLEQRLELIKQIQAMLEQKDEYKDKDKDEITSDATAMADTYLRDNFRTLYTQYSDVADYINALKEKFGDINEDVKELLSKLNPDQLAFLEDIKIDDLSSWEDLQHIIEYLSTADLSNLKVVTDPEAALESATAQYDLYSSLSDQIAGSKKQTISKEEYEKLAPDVQEFFSLMANGQYKMTGDAKEFYDTVNNLSLDGFKQNISELENSNERLKNLQNIDFNKLSQSAATKNEDGSFSFQKEDVNQQLDFLTEMGYSLEKIVQWKAEIDDGHTTTGVLGEIAAAVGDFSNQTNKLSTYLQANQDAIYQNQLAIARSTDSFKTLKQYLDEGLISEQAFTQAAIELDTALDTQNLDPEELEDYADHLQQTAKQSDELSDELEDNEDAAKIVAKGIMKMNDAVEKLADNWEDWSDILENSSDMSEEYADTMGEARETVADLLDISKDYVSEDFIKDHLDEIAEAATGSEDAIDGLKSSLAEDIIARIMVENGIDETAQAQVLSDVADLQAMIPNIEVGATIDDGDFLNKANQLIQDCGMTVDQANAAFDALGFEANFATEEQKVTQRVPKTVTKTEVIGYNSGTSTDPAGQPIDWSYPILSQWSYNDGFAEEEGTIDVPAMATNGKTPVINSLTRKAGGGSNNYSSGNRGGKSPGKSSGGNKGKGGGGKGSGKGNEPDKSQKDRKKAMEDDRDIYHDINIELEQINRQLDRTQKKQDRLYGKQLLDNLNKQSRILDQHKAKLEEKHDLQKQDLISQQQTLKNLGVTFDKYGNIANYMDILGNKQAQVNAKTKEYNSLIEAYNKSTDKDIKKQIADEAEKLDKQIKQYEDEYKNLEDKIKNYDSLHENMQDVVDQIEEETQKQIEINIKKFRMEVEIRLDMGEAERDWNKFRREVLEHTDIIKDTDFQEIFSDATQGTRDITSYFNVRGSKGSLQTLTEQLMDTRAEIEAIDKTGSSAIYGDNKAQAMEDLQNDLKELMGQMEDIQELIDNIDKAYLDTVGDVEDQFNKQIEDYEYIGDLIEHDIDLLSLIYGDKNYDAMNKYYETLERNNLKQLDSLKKQRDFWKEQWDAAVARGDTKAAKQFEENYKETIKDLNETVENAAKNIQDKYINAIDKIFDELDKKISNGKGTDYLNTEWELMNKNADEYLDTINTAFAIQETERKYQKALDETKNIKNQQALKKLMDEQLGILKNKEKVTQYDVDRAEKLLQVEQARIALQDAQSAKTSMRLKRDSQGNYSYEYVADNGAVDDAQDNLAKAQNDLYNFDKDRYKSNLDDMLSAWKDFQSEYKDILEDASLAEQDKIEKLSLLREQYGQYINDKTAENLVVRNNLMESAFSDLAALYNTDVENYNQMSIDEQNILMGDLVPAWESGIQQMADKVAGEGGFIPVCEDAFNDITDATKEYEEQLDNMANAAGISLNYVTQGVDLLSDAFMDLVEDNDELVDRMYTEVDAIKTLQDAARELVNEYQNIYNEAKTAVSEIHNFIQQEQGRAAAYAETANVAIDSYNRTARAYVDAYDQMASAFEDYAARVRAAASGDSSGGGSGSGGSGSGSSGSGNGSGSSSSSSSSSQNWFNNRGIKVKRGGGVTMATGGYTGDWHSDEGRVAVLHEKELVLNKDDTKNFLDGIKILRHITSGVQSSLFAKAENMNIKSLMNNENADRNQIDQNVQIEATFPNVNSKREIEEAFNDLVNLAAQRAMRR